MIYAIVWSRELAEGVTAWVRPRPCLYNAPRRHHHPRRTATCKCDRPGSLCGIEAGLAISPPIGGTGRLIGQPLSFPNTHLERCLFRWVFENIIDLFFFLT